MKFIDNLVGSQIIDMCEKSITVKTKNGQTLQFDFICEQGDCCGYAEIKNTLYFKPDDNNNPVITNLVMRTEEKDCCKEVILILFGEYKALADYRFECGSGSGWCYGATISVACKIVPDVEELCSW